MLGSPVQHSLSPALHRAAYGALGLVGWTYEAVEVGEPALPQFLLGLDTSWVGLSLTMPLKQAVLTLLDVVSPLAGAVGAVNTVVLEASGRRFGDNTDVHGIVAALGEAGVGSAARAAVLGAGATAASALAALADLGCREPEVYAREPRRAGPLLDAAERLGVRPRLAAMSEVGEAAGAGRWDVVVSTLPAGAADRLDLVPAGGDVRLPPLLDVVYAPWPTELAGSWARAGGVVVGGLVMLTHQAGRQVELMTGRQAPLAAMREAGEAELARRAATPRS